jgi:competence protein ComEC
VAAWLRVRFLAGVRAYLGRVEGAVVEGMVLGIRTGLPDEVEDTFRRSGLVHLLAVSGSNVALVAGLMRWLLRWAGVRPSLTGSLIGTWVFAATASGGPSVGRAAVMATVMLLGRLLGRPHHPLNSLAVAVVLLTAANPCAWEDPGFWLSVAATAGILGMASGRAGTPPASGCSGRVVRLLLGLMRAGREVLAVTCAAQAAVLPVSLYYFQQASLVAPLSNLMVFPFTGAVTVGGMACATLAAVHPGLGVAFSPLRMLVRAVLGLARFFGDLPGAAVTLPAPRWPHLLAYYVAFAWVAGWLRWSLLPRHGPWTRPRLVVAALLVVVILAVSLATAPPRHILQVVFFSVGQGDAILLWRPGGPAMLVDCGPLGPGYDAGADTVIPYLRRHGIRRLDLLVLTHGHADHTGGAAAVLGNLPVAHLWLGPGASLPSLAGADASTATAPAGASGSVAPEAWRDVPGCVLRPVAGERAVLAPGWEVIVLHPPHPVGGAASASAGQGRGPAAWGISGGAGLTPAASGSGEREGGDDGQNDSSLVLLVRYGRVNILLAGDLETVGEALFLREGARLCPRGVDLLKVPHHGSATSCSAAFLDRVRPRFAVVQVGPNPFGHPAAATVRRLKEAGARVWRTDLHGAVVARTDGRRLSVTAVLGHGAVAGVWGSSAEARR